MNLRTFILPKATRPAAIPAVGEQAPPLWSAGAAGRPAVIAFLRHTGCPFAEATLVAARRLAADDAGADWIAVSHASREATDTWCEAIGGCGRVRLVIDEPRALYAAWGLGRTTLGHFAGRRSLGGVLRLARSGIRNRHPNGTRWQRAGTFALDADRVIRWRHLPEHAGDLPDLEAARAAL
jgi:hypothetical protein